MTELRRGIPAGQTRVIGVDLFDHTDYLVRDYADREVAITAVNQHNMLRKGPMDDVQYAYDDTGKLVAGGNATVAVHRQLAHDRRCLHYYDGTECQLLAGHVGPRPLYKPAALPYNEPVKRDHTGEHR